jgi:hypothetical protein
MTQNNKPRESFPLKYIASRKKELTLMALSFLIGGLLVGFLLEWYFQNKYWSAAGTQFDSELGWSAMPNLAIEDKTISYHTNSLGFRSEEVDMTKEHILVLGDSVVWGLGVQDDETVTAYLGKHFSDYQVLNLGVSGYGIDQYYMQLKRSISNLNPKLVIVNIFTGNDWGDFTQDIQYGKSKPLFRADPSSADTANEEGIPYQVNKSKLILTNSPVSKYSCSNLFSRSWTLSLPAFEPVRKSICTVNRLPEKEVHYVFLGLLFKIGELVSQAKSALLFVLTPSKSDFDYDFKNWDEYFKYLERDEEKAPTFFNKKGQMMAQSLFRQIPFPYIDFYEEVKGNDWKVEDLYLPRDNDHLSPLGLRYLAKTIQKKVSSTNQ